MKIEYIIGLDTLGSDNNDNDNFCFAAAVKQALEQEYPDTEIATGLGEFSQINILDIDFDDQSIKKRITDISNNIWGNANY